MTTQRRWLVSATLLSAALVFGVTRRVPQTLYCDPAYQLKALQQFLVGETSSFNRMATADPKDLTRDTTEWFSWWPPGAQLLTYPFLVRGMAIGHALRLDAMALILMGCVGWVLWFKKFDLPSWILWGLAVALPWMRYPSNLLFAFSAEGIAFALTPWILWSAEILFETDRATSVIAFCFGMGLGSCYVLKYSIVFASLAALLYLWPRWKGARFVAAVLGFAIPVVILNYINYHVSHDMNPVATTMGLHLKPLSILWVFVLPALGLTDAYSWLMYMFLHPVHGWFQHEWIIGAIGFPGAVLLMILLSHRLFSPGPDRLALLTLFLAMAAIFIVWNLTGVGNYDARYFTVFSLAVLPVVLKEGLLILASNAARPWKIVLAIAGIFYLAIPLAYGVVSVLVKTERLPSDYQYGPSHLYNAFISDKDLKSVRQWLLQDYRPSTDIWYLPDPVTALDFPGRAIICFADFYPMEELKQMHYATSAPRRIKMLLPPKLEEDGKAEVIRRSFPQAQGWTQKQIPGSTLILWETDLKPT